MRIRGISPWVGILAAAAPLLAQDDVVVKAMRDEMARSMGQLQLQNLEKPYFIAYRVVETSSTNVSSSFGALRQSSEFRLRRLGVEVRVGDYKLDNTNFFSPNYNMNSMTQVFNGAAQLPLEDDYKELRRQIWLATDATYKKAVEDLSKKRASLQNKNRTDDTPDFSKETPVTTTADLPAVHADRAHWETMVRSLSALFRQMPDIYTSQVSLSATNTFTRYVNSEGTSYVRHQPAVTMNASAATQAPDGTPLDDFAWDYAKSMAEFPAEAELASQLRALGQRLKDLRGASTLENYNGPVLFEGDGAAQIFRLNFLPALLGTRGFISDMSGMQQSANQGDNPFVDKIGARVMPDFLSVTDNPTLQEFNKTRLAGWCTIDDDGIPVRETKLVEKGYLKTLLTTRNPVRGIEHSTGSHHGGGPVPSNVFVTVENGLSAAELRAKFLDLVKQRNKEFGILVRRMRNATSPVLAYKVFPDGREELVHGTQFAGLNNAVFKEIVAASKEPNILTVEFRPRMTMPMMSPLDSGYMPVTLVVPSLLFEDVNLRKTRGETPKPPVADHPFFSK